MASVPKNRFSQDESRRNADHVSFLKHRGFRWLWIALGLSVISALGYILIDQEPRPNGGSWYGEGVLSDGKQLGAEGNRTAEVRIDTHK